MVLYTKSHKPKISDRPNTHDTYIALYEVKTNIYPFYLFTGSLAYMQLFNLGIIIQKKRKMLSIFKFATFVKYLLCCFVFSFACLFQHFDYNSHCCSYLRKNAEWKTPFNTDCVYLFIFHFIFGCQFVCITVNLFILLIIVLFYFYFFEQISFFGCLPVHIYTTKWTDMRVDDVKICINCK